ncbi:serine hydrolase [Paraburkholderia sediminicola]|uniref:serine hydrolase domain-containing protein n=1 Tax=Paraburkholderia sediminicola TaxID=458836 RepID=UPI0038BBC246
MNHHDSPTVVAQLDALLAPFDRSDAPGLVLAVAHHGKVLYRRGVGMASLEHALANTPATRMRIGSTTKHFACLAALLLAEEGKLDVNSGIRTYVPELPLLSGDPTLVQLMTHTAGYRCFLDLAMLTQGFAMVPRGGALDAQVRQRDVNFPPGERMMYSNGGYQLLSEAIERVSGVSFESFLKHRLFDVIGMTDTDSVPDDMTVRTGMATLHVPDGKGGYRRGIFPSWEMRGEGAVVSTADDMLRWIAHLRGPKRLGTALTWQRMLTLPRYSSGVRGSYSLGLMQTPYRGVELLHHSGGVIGGSCQMLAVAEHALDVIILSNGAPVNPIDLSKRIVDTVLGDALSGADMSEPARSEGCAALCGQYYSRRTHGLHEIVDQDGKLALISFNFQPMPMPLVDIDGVLQSDAGPEGAVQVLHEPLPTRGVASHIEVVHCGHAETFARMPEIRPSPADVARMIAGSYRSGDAAADASIALEDGVLLMHLHGQLGAASYRLDPLAEDVFAFTPTDPLSLMCGVLTADCTKGGVERFWIGTWRTRHLLFTRQA